jgi:D-glycero-D-manno-heptose 1,7-bisphosphate phosphatase
VKKALFLDRDGVINIEKNYLHKIEEFEFIDGIFSLVQKYVDKGFIPIVVTNQSGIARGYYREEDFSILTEWMVAEFKKQKIEIKAVYHCPHHPDFSGECSCRKPKPGMLFEAAEAFDIDLENSILVGDSERDIEAAIVAGVKTTYLFSDSKQSKATNIVQSLYDV